MNSRAPQPEALPWAVRIPVPGGGHTSGACLDVPCPSQLPGYAVLAQEAATRKYRPATHPYQVLLPFWVTSFLAMAWVLTVMASLNLNVIKIKASKLSSNVKVEEHTGRISRYALISDSLARHDHINQPHGDFLTRPIMIDQSHLQDKR
ncbi:uncharacterized protein CIMG_08176 [Coccidioides immitis RS]|uniref:Uncharacterized protein n=4 Tax=Coccidioides immitis TaxID=5501 RepID=J3K4Z6_COCIM|nr:uncharacterized protein CIMG_08176 [Coccidioides immitis RS]EAS29430.3 hypothetical protein CIMG_08176 [Coccidioides immitis RS]KMP06573.1 hypothetical protein CIRG_06255 [Coccidioides immitis RMSCC 2394]KMU73756.1 hypothetical protein CISG_03805 [Coccidioides immitis RMSCC 3703]KMU84142.1 hypothetical protein CIHG_01929 [Coccidioides immitis H538.4]